MYSCVRLSQVRHVMGGLRIASILLSLRIAAEPVAYVDPNATLQRILHGIAQSESSRDGRVKEYTRVQHYRAMSSRFDENADMVVRMHYERGRGKDYVTLSRSGSASVQTRVFEKLLSAEVELAREKDREPTLFTTYHYQFRIMGMEMMSGNNCYVLELNPLHPDKRLFRGKAWVDARDNAVVRVEGRLNTNVSFWVGRPDVVEEFSKFGEFWFATKRDAVAKSFLLGTCQLHIDYGEYKIAAR